MIVGIDVTHPAPKSMEGTPSIAAVVASEDTTYTRYPGSIRCQASKVEIVQNIDIMMRERLDHWKEKNRRLPERILVYRDGVSEGQYRSLLMSEPDKTGKYRISELDGIRKACEERYRPGPMPKITIVVVGKRHHTRFYPTQEVDADMSSKGNCKNGTIVDRGVTMEKGVSVSTSISSATLILMSEVRFLPTSPFSSPRNCKRNVTSLMLRCSYLKGKTCPLCGDP